MYSDILGFIISWTVFDMFFGGLNGGHVLTRARATLWGMVSDKIFVAWLSSCMPLPPDWSARTGEAFEAFGCLRAKILWFEDVLGGSFKACFSVLDLVSLPGISWKERAITSETWLHQRFQFDH